MSATGSATLSRTSPCSRGVRPCGRRLAGFLEHARQVDRKALGILDDILFDVRPKLGAGRIAPSRFAWPFRMTWSWWRFSSAGVLLTHYHETCLTVQLKPLPSWKQNEATPWRFFLFGLALSLVLGLVAAGCASREPAALARWRHARPGLFPISTFRPGGCRADVDRADDRRHAYLKAAGEANAAQATVPSGQTDPATLRKLGATHAEEMLKAIEQ